jgi:hypothetical protein
VNENLIKRISVELKPDLAAHSGEMWRFGRGAAQRGAGWGPGRRAGSGTGPQAAGGTEPTASWQSPAWELMREATSAGAGPAGSTQLVLLASGHRP